MGVSNTIQQLSVFLENREGRLDDVLKVLAEKDVNIVALSLADTSDYGMLRMIVSDPAKGRQALKEAGITAMLTDVVALRVPHPCRDAAQDRVVKARVPAPCRDPRAARRLLISWIGGLFVGGGPSVFPGLGVSEIRGR